MRPLTETESGPEIEVSTTSSRTVSPDDTAHQPAAPAHDRGHEGAQAGPAFLQRSPETAIADDVLHFQLHLVEGGISICNRNRIMTGVTFLFRVTLRRHDLAAEIYHLKEPQKLPLIMSPGEARRLLAMAGSVKVR